MGENDEATAQIPKQGRRNMELVLYKDGKGCKKYYHSSHKVSLRVSGEL